MKKLFSLLLALLVALSGFPAASEAEDNERIRIAGSSRFDTSILTATEFMNRSYADQFDTVILVSGTNFADALAGSYLAYVKNAPLLITEEKYGDDTPYTKINKYIKENLSSDGTIYVLGGTAAVSEKAIADLNGYNIKRLSGKNRYLTNLAILKEAGVTNEDILVSTGINYADSLSASGAKKPLLLVDPNGLSEDQKTYLDGLKNSNYDNNFYILGGTSAVSTAVEEQIGEYGVVERVKGATRYETSVKIAEKFCNGADTVVLAYSLNFPDGLCGGPLAAAVNGPVLLTKTDEEAAAAEFCKQRGIRKGYVLGGKSLISDEAMEKILNPAEAPASEIVLTADKYELNINGDYEVIFYAATDGKVENLYLYEGLGNSVVGQMLDDGNYSSSGDDLPGDNIYSFRLYLDNSEETVYTFYAADAVKSNTVQISVIPVLSDPELTDMDTTENIIQEQLFEIEGYESMTIEERKAAADAMFEQLIAEGLIYPESLSYDEESQTYTFVYTSDVLGTVIIRDWSDETNGAEYALAKPVLNESEDADTSGRDGERQVVESDKQSYDPNYAGNNVIGKALILWSFDQSWDTESFRRPFYGTTETDWDNKGLDTTVIYDTTVNSYKNLKGYNVIVFSGHGQYATYKTGFLGLGEHKTLSSLLLHEKSSWSKNSEYSDDLKQFRVGKASVKGGTMYAILPDFFTYYYDSDDLDGSFVYAENCEFYGKDGNVVYTMMNAINSRSAETVIGFHNSVMANYSRELMKDYVDSLIDGYTTKQAFDNAVQSNGSDDYFTGREQYGPTAYPIYRGNDSSRLVNSGLLNGDFELGNTPLYWNHVGDTRIINKLGDLTPVKNNRMAVLTTGIGSAEEDYLAGTEGSVLSQAVRIPVGTKTLTFSYDFVSEEPMEYVGSSFDDTFLVQIVSTAGTEDLYRNSINSAEEWYSIDNIDFDGGDSTTYHTIWQTVNVDVSQYAGQIVNIRFMVYDVGDSIYDSAILLDNVALN